MSTSTKRDAHRSHVPTSALAKSVEFDEEAMRVTLIDGRVLSVPLMWFPVLHRATPDQRSRYEIAGGGISLHWPDIDEDLSVPGLSSAVHQQPISPPRHSIPLVFLRR